MNVSLQLCGLVIAIFLFVLYKSHSTLGLHGERLFMLVIAATMICLSLDVLSVLAIHFRSLLPPFLTALICKAYIISMVWVGWGNLCYVTLDLQSEKWKHSDLQKWTKIITLAESAVIAVLPIDVYENGIEVYSFGPAVVSTYIFVLCFILSTLIVAVYIRRKKNSRRGLAVIMATSLWIFSAALQMFNNAMLLVGFSMAVGVMILYVVMENPDSNLDRQLGCFNSHAMQNYLSMLLEEGEAFHVLDFSVTDAKTLEDRGLDVIEAARNIVVQIEHIRDVKVFKNMSIGLVAVSREDGVLEEVSRQIMDVVSRYKEASSNVMTFIVENAEQFSSSGEIQKFLSYIRSQSGTRLSAMVHVSESMIRQYNQSHEIENEVDLALKEDRVEVFLQPICHPSEGTPIFAEALVRIRKKDGGLLSPGLFIPVAETTGQIRALGERVLEKVCVFLRDSEAVSLGLRAVDVNLSAVQCDDSNLSGRLSQIVESCGIAPELISFEITETAVSAAKDVLIENMNTLVSRGFSFSLDDFGKGESNLMYIVEMPCQIIKLDMDMSRACFNNPKGKSVVEAIVDMSKKLNLVTIAEGIETADEVSGISSLGIDYIQGYYFSKPLPMNEFLEYMRIHGRPVGKAESTETEQDTDTSPSSEDIAAAAQRMLNSSVLLVEDNEMNREIAEIILEDYGLTVDTAEDGTEAVEKVSRAAPGQYSLIFMDIRMPIMDGYEATRRIRAMEDKALATLPIVALTAQDTEEDRRAAFEAGMNSHILKPLDDRKLNELFAMLLPE